MKPHGDLGGEEGNLPVTVSGPPGAIGLENQVPDQGPGHLTGQRADEDMLQPKSVRLWLLNPQGCPLCPQEHMDCREEAAEEGASLWPVVLPYCSEWLPGQCDPNSTSPPRPGSTALVHLPLTGPP